MKAALATLPPMHDAAWINALQWDANGLMPVIAQEARTGDVLMFAWMNREALQRTVALKQAVYFSRSRQRLWHKGEESGHFQVVQDIAVDCDADVILLTVVQTGHEPGIACHTGRHSCFYRHLEGEEWVSTAPVLKAPETMYPK